MTLLQQAKEFFDKLNSNSDALSTLKYDSVMHLKTKDSNILISVKGGRVAEVKKGDAPLTDMDYVFEESEEGTFAKIFNGEMTIGQASWEGKIYMVHFAAHRGQIVALNRAILKTQKSLYPQLP